LLNAAVLSTIKSDTSCLVPCRRSQPEVLPAGPPAPINLEQA
jgi:hypothetical protein